MKVSNFSETKRHPRGAIATSFVLIIAAVVIIALVLGVLASLPLIAGKSGTTTVTQTTTSITTVASVAAATSTSNTSTGGQLNAGQIYAGSSASIVTVQGYQVQNSLFGPQVVGILGSGFVVQYSSADYILTNFHVAGSTTNLTVTFTNGDAYAAKVIGSDPYADLAVVSVENAPASLFHPMTLVSSSSLFVGQPIAAIGNPFGLSGTMTVGIISQLGRTIQDPTAGNFSIANAIQFSAPINPGNSGGALLNAQGMVVGITTAVISGSQGVGFAIPSETIIRELPSLIANGSYLLHSYLGIAGANMNYQLARVSRTNVTYGVLIGNVFSGSPAAAAGLRGGNTVVTIGAQQFILGGDIITSINGTTIINNDALASYLEANTVAGQTVTLGIIRAGTPMNVNVVLAARPPLSS